MAAANQAQGLSLTGFFKYYIYAPYSNLLSSKERRVAIVFSWFLTIISGSLLPKISRSYFLNSMLQNPAIKKDHHCQTIAQIIAQTRDPVPGGDEKKLSPSQKEALKQSKLISTVQIVDNLFIGDGTAFAQTTGFDCSIHVNGQKAGKLDTSNPLQFKTVITLCPLDDIKNDMSADLTDIASKSRDAFAASLKGLGIDWRFVGKLIGDKPEWWKPLVHDCTLLGTELAEKDYVGFSNDARKEINDQKNCEIDKKDVSEWFEPIFELIDKAVFGPDKVLVHCGKGRSRSAAVLAAYFIKRCGVTGDQAIAFLRSKRMCVDTKFVNELNAYAQALSHQKR